MTPGEEAAAELARVVDGDAEGEAFHGPALARVLADVGPAEAGARPIPEAHTIAEILAHVVAWREWTAARLEEDSPPDVEDDGWVVSAPVDTVAWAALRARLDASARRLGAALAAVDPAAWDRLRGLARFAIHHEVHHLGQVALLRRARSTA